MQPRGGRGVPSLVSLCGKTRGVARRATPQRPLQVTYHLLPHAARRTMCMMLHQLSLPTITLLNLVSSQEQKKSNYHRTFFTINIKTGNIVADINIDNRPNSSLPMSNSLFRAKQVKSRRNLKSLNISAPMLADVREASPVSNMKTSTKSFPSVILVVKYSFTAELDAELSVKKGAFVKLLNRPRNGWLFVQYLDSYQARGLIPASYVDIEVNDTQSPVTMEWLTEMETETEMAEKETEAKTHETNKTNKSHEKNKTYETNKTNISNEYNPQLKSQPESQSESQSGSQPPRQSTDSSANNLFSFGTAPETLEPSAPALSPSSIFEAPAAPKSISISNVLQSSVGGVWYRVDVRMSDQSMVYVAKRYQDFYNLHVALLQTTTAISQLPRLPQPIRTNMVGVMSRPRTDRVYLENLLVRCNELNYYVNQLIKASGLNGMEIYNWIMATSDARLVFASEAAVNMFSDDINEKLCPNSTNVMAVLLPKMASDKVFPTTSTSLNSLSSLLDTYENPSDQHSDHADNSSDIPEPPDSSQDSEHSTWELNSAGNSTADTSADESNSEKNCKPRLPKVSTIDTRVRHTSSSSAESIFSAIHKSAPSTPTLNYYADQVSPSTPVEFHEKLPVEKPRSQSTSAPAAGDLIKIKVSLNNAQGDIVALRIKRTNLMSVVYLKKLLSHKIYKDFNLIHHYKLVAEGERDMDDEALLDYMKLQTKVHLTLRRVRQSSTK